MTRGANVEYNLSVSPYRVETEHAVFVFSSALHVEKFNSKQAAHRQKICVSLSNRFNIRVNLDALADLILYRSIEQRGFLIITDGEEIDSINNVILANEKICYKKND